MLSLKRTGLTRKLVILITLVLSLVAMSMPVGVKKVCADYECCNNCIQQGADCNQWCIDVSPCPGPGCAQWLVPCRNACQEQEMQCIINCGDCEE